MNSSGSEWSAKPATAMHGDADLDELEPLRDQGLVVAVGEFAAEPGQEEERHDQGRAGERDQGPRIVAADTGTG